MATSESPLPYPEHDKLGPLGTRASALHDPVELRARLLAEFAQGVQAARAAAATANTADAVHEARKALRRCRAVLAMVTHALPKGERRAVQHALKDARRSLSTVRDHAVAPDSLAAVDLSDDDRDTARRVLDNAAQALPTSADIKQLLAEAAARAAAQAEALEAALPAGISWETIGEGIRDVYADARRARRASKRSRSWFHAWRRRSKELVAQLDFVGRHAGARAQAIHDELDGVTGELGPPVDLIMLREFVATHAQGIGDGAIDHLRDTIDERLDELMKQTRKGARDAYSLKPKKFEKRLLKSIKRDLTPADELENGQLD